VAVVHAGVRPAVIGDQGFGDPLPDQQGVGVGAAHAGPVDHHHVRGTGLPADALGQRRQAAVRVAVP